MNARKIVLHGMFSLLVAALLLACAPRDADAAGVVETSLGLSFNRSQYSDDNYKWSRKLGGSVGYHLGDLTEIEVGYQDAVERTKLTNYQDTTIHDQVYSINWVQNITGKNFPIRPYVKVGVGQLNREATGNYYVLGNVSAPPAVEDSVIGILGAGLRVYLTRNFGLRGEVSTYLTGGSIATWKNDVSVTLGLSAYF